MCEESEKFDVVFRNPFYCGYETIEKSELTREEAEKYVEWRTATTLFMTGDYSIVPLTIRRSTEG